MFFRTLVLYERRVPMSAVNELISYIDSLTPEEINKIISQLPRLTSLLEESSQLCPQGQSPQK